MCDWQERAESGGNGVGQGLAVTLRGFENLPPNLNHPRILGTRF